MAFHGGPMKTKPALAHFRANSEFSLSCISMSVHRIPVLEFMGLEATDEAISRMYALAAFALGYLYNPVPV